MKILNRVRLTLRRPGFARFAFYMSFVVLAATVYSVEVYQQNRPQVYGVAHDSPSQAQQAELTTFLEMNQLITTLGTTLLGALGFLLASRHKENAAPRELWAAFLSAACVGLSLYFGYHAYEDLITTFQQSTFDLTDNTLEWDRKWHFNTFLLGVFFFADFAFNELTKKDGSEHVHAVKNV